MKSTLDTLTTALPDTIKTTRLYRALRTPWRAYQKREWHRHGRRLPPPAFIKQELVRAYGQRFGLKTLIETGTQYGEMLLAVASDFDQIYSIELSFDLWAKAQKRLAPYPHITLLQGDSGDVLPTLLPTITGPALFWLDAHAMRGGVRASLITPIMQELATIGAHNVAEYVILIDDAHLFQGRADYPTIPQLTDFVTHWGKQWIVTVETDVIRIHPESANSPN